MRVSGEPALDNLGNLARLAKFVDLAAQYNLLVMLDMHRLNANGGIDEVCPSFVAWFDLSEYGKSSMLEMNTLDSVLSA